MDNLHAYLIFSTTLIQIQNKGALRHDATSDCPEVLLNLIQIQDDILLLKVKQTLFGHFCAKHLKLYYSEDFSSFAENCLSILSWHNELHLTGAKLETKPMTWLCFLCEL
jgi:hypothetical protein